VNGSSPDAQPADQMRIVRSSPASSSTFGITVEATNSHVGASRKNPVTLMRIVSKSSVTSRGSASRYER
jgi:hypothetical protein